MPSYLGLIQFRRATSEEWSGEPVLLKGEMGMDTTLMRAKLGDGVTPWDSLPWVGEPGPEGPEGPPGPNTIPAADFIGSEISRPGSPAEAALITAIAGVVGEAFSDPDSEIATAAAAATELLIETGVPPLVASALADNPSILAEAAALAQSDAGLVRTTDSRIGQDVGTFPGWKEIVVNRDGYVISGVMDDGTVYNFFDTANPARTADPITVPGYRNLVFDKTKTVVIEGDRTDGTKYFHRLAADVLEIPDNAITRLKAVASFGDSMTGDDGGTGVSTGAQIGIALGLPAFQGGVPGQTSTEAAFRAGGIEMWATVTGGSIPTSGTVAVVIAAPTGTWKTGSAWTFAVTAITEDGAQIPGSLVKAADDTWTFQASALGSAKAVPREVKFVSTQAPANAQRGIIFRAGRNNLSVDTIVRDYVAVRDYVYATQSRPRYLALPVYNPASAPSGTPTYDTYMAINAAIAKEMGPDFYDLRRWFYKYGLSAAGITPTTQDTADIAQDIVPTSLRQSGTDNTHLSPAGRIAEANQLAYVITSRGWFSS